MQCFVSTKLPLDIKQLHASLEYEEKSPPLQRFLNQHPFQIVIFVVLLSSLVSLQHSRWSQKLRNYFYRVPKQSFSRKKGKSRNLKIKTSYRGNKTLKVHKIEFRLPGI